MERGGDAVTYRINEFIDVEKFDLVAMCLAANGGGPPQTQQWIVLGDGHMQYYVAHREPQSPVAVTDMVIEHGLHQDDHNSAYESAVDYMVRRAMQH